MAVHPIDYRYGTEEMKAVWTEEHKLERMLDVEVALARAEEATGDVPEGTGDAIAEAADDVDLDRVKEIEAEIHHDVMAVVRAVQEQCPEDPHDYGEYVHFGATSNDVIDTADALRLRESCDRLEAKLHELRDALVERADEHKRTTCIGRTHGQHGVPTTWGHKLAIWASEVDRHCDRLDEIRERVEVGQMSGAVGTQASFGENAREIGRRTMEELGLDEAEISNQLLARDRHAEYVAWLANVATTCDKIGVDVRNMQRTEIAEVEEGFGEEQVGSSTMPHKRNPVKSENVCGLARVVRGFVQTELRNNTLWEERDLTNSSSERVVFTEATVLTDHVLAYTIDVVEGLGFHDEAIRANLELLDGVNMAEAVMMALARRGMGRQRAHERVRDAAMRAQEESDVGVEEALLDDETIASQLDPDEIAALVDPDDYLGTAVERVEDVVDRLS